MTRTEAELREELIKDFGMSDDWKVQAKCRTLPISLSDALFFPPGSKDEFKRERESLCFKCPVREECENYGNATGDTWAAWGGFLPSERRIRRRNHRKVG